jgi:hypothetical protein
MRYFFRLSHHLFSLLPEAGILSLLTLQLTLLSKSGCKCMNYIFTSQIFSHFILKIIFRLKNKPAKCSENELFAYKYLKNVFLISDYGLASPSSPSRVSVDCVRRSSLQRAKVENKGVEC